MPFDPQTFEAETTLHLIPTEELPNRAMEAVEAGFDGPNVIRMAILNPNAPYEIEQALPAMLAELGCRKTSAEQAATLLAHQRAERILSQNEDPLLEWSYFLRVYHAADYPVDLSGLAYALDECDYLDISLEQQRALAIDALEEFLSPELRQQRMMQRQAAWEQGQEKIKNDWPYTFDSPTRKALLGERLAERARDARIFLIILPLSWALGAWVFGILYIFFLALATIVFVPAFAYGAEYRRMKRERRDILLRANVPEDQI